MTTAEKNALINTMIVKLLKEGFDIKTALDAVCGEGTYERLAGEVYHAIRAKHGLE